MFTIFKLKAKITFEESFFTSKVFAQASRALEGFQRLMQQLSRRSKGEGKKKFAKNLERVYFQVLNVEIFL